MASEQVLVDRILLVIKGSPKEDGKIAEGFRVATAMIAMDVLPQILFADDGVLWLIKKQPPKAKNREPASERLRTISDLTGFHILSDSLNQRGVKENDLDENYNTTRLSLEQAAALISQNDAVITF